MQQQQSQYVESTWGMRVFFMTSLYCVHEYKKKNNKN